MKKIFVLAIAAIAMTFVSCGNKTEANAEAVDSLLEATELTEDDANAAAEAVISALSEKIEAKDASAIQGILETVKAKVAEFIAQNPEVAKEYLVKVQSFLKENAESIKAVIGTDTTIAGLVDGITNIPTESVDALTNAADALKALGIDVADKAADAAEAAQDAAVDAVESAKDAAKEAADNAKTKAEEKVNEKVDETKAKAAGAIDDAAAAAKKKLGL